VNQAQCPSCPKNPQKGAVYYQDAGDKKKVWRANEHGVWEEVKFARSRVITPELLEAADKLNTTVNYLWGEGKTFTKVGSVKEIRAYYPDASAYTLEYKVTNQPDVYISVKNKRNKIIHLFTTPTPENIDFSFTFIKDTVVFANDNDINTTLRDLVDHFNEVQDLNPIIIVEGYANVTKLSDLNHR
jgi:hypothetical protein